MQESAQRCAQVTNMFICNRSPRLSQFALKLAVRRRFPGSFDFAYPPPPPPNNSSKPPPGQSEWYLPPPPEEPPAAPFQLYKEPDDRFTETITAKPVKENALRKFLEEMDLGNREKYQSDLSKMKLLEQLKEFVFRKDIGDIIFDYFFGGFWDWLWSWRFVFVSIAIVILL